MIDRINKNLDRIDEKLKELTQLRKFIKKQIDEAQNDFRRRMAYAELIKSLLEVDKTILAYIKESNAVLYKLERDKNNNSKDGKDKQNILLSMISNLKNEVEDEVDDLRQEL